MWNLKVFTIIKEKEKESFRLSVEIDIGVNCYALALL